MSTQKISKDDVKIKDLILTEYEEGNIVVSTHDGLRFGKLSEIIEQETSGLLYDLNRDAGTILTFIEDPKWVNDYACMQVIVALKEQLKKIKETNIYLENKFGENKNTSNNHLIHNHKNLERIYKITEDKVIVDSVFEIFFKESEKFLNEHIIVKRDEFEKVKTYLTIIKKHNSNNSNKSITKFKIQRYPELEKKYNCSENECVIDAQFFRFFPTSIKNIATDMMHIIVSVETFNGVEKFINSSF